MSEQHYLKTMMTSVVERLRYYQKVFEEPKFHKAFHVMAGDIGQAADEIELLREQLKEANEIIKELQMMMKGAQ